MGSRTEPMNAIQRIFGKPRVLLPVIHARSSLQIFLNAELARMNGADGVLLINQGPMSSFEILEQAKLLSSMHPGWWVGVNILGAEDLNMLRDLRETPIRGLWSDDAGVYGDSTEAEVRDLALEVAEARGSWGGLYMAGVAFKYRAPVSPDNWGHVAWRASLLADVVVTSGNATGSAPPREKLEIMRQAVGDHALGIASGVSMANIDQFPSVNAFLVASSLLFPGVDEHFDPGAVKEMADRVHQGP